jgi:hypothetical protein
MDTHTVLEIIKMIDAQLLHIARKHAAKNLTDVKFFASSLELTNLREHLQDYIEAQVSYAENQTGE